METQIKKFSTYSQYANQWLKDNQIRLKTVYVEDSNYNPYFIYLNRIANCSNPKFRILQRGKDNVKNCIMVTFNTEAVDKEYLSYLIQSKIKLINHCSHGSCHRFITLDILGRIISGTVLSNGLDNKAVLL